MEISINDLIKISIGVVIAFTAFITIKISKKNIKQIMKKSDDSIQVAGDYNAPKN